MAEIAACPNCQRQLQVPENFFGQTVQCPDCAHQFVVQAPAGAVQTEPPPISSASEIARPPRRLDDDSDYPRRRQKYDDDDNDDDDDVDTRRFVHRYSSPHRGGLIMTLGLVSLIGGWMLCLPVVVGPFAWVMANNDLREIRAGRMDPSGEGMTRTGQVCGILATLVLVLGLLAIGFFCVVGMIKR